VIGDWLLAAAEVSEVLPSASGFVLIGAGAFVLPIVARRLAIPSVVLEILYGLILGPSMLNIIRTSSADADFIALLAELGLLLLIFLAGFEIDFDRLERQGAGPLLTGVAVLLITAAAAWIGFGWLGMESTDQRIFLTLLVSAASLGIVIPALRDTNRTSTRLGQLVIVAAVLAEFLSAAAIVIYGGFVENGVGVSLLGVPALFLVTVVALLLIRRLAWWHPATFERLFAERDPDEMGIRTSLALLFVFVGLSIALNVEPLLGAFLAGAMFAYLFRNNHQLETRLSGFAFGFFIPVFFINVGLLFPLDALLEPSVLARAAALIGIAVGAKLIASLVFVARGFTLRESTAAGVVLAGQLSVIIALAEFGVELGLIDEGLEAGAILLVGITAILSPIAFRLLAPPLAAPADEAASDELR
jgi:Kef-type K+ transport system membrane component KefB